MTKRMLIMLTVVGLVLGAVFGFIEFKGRMIKQFMTTQGEPPQTVSTMTANYQNWLPKLAAVGSVRASQGVDLSAEVAGVVNEIHFKQGDNVTIHAPLLQLRADNDLAKLKSLAATAELARITYRRNEAQLNAKAISQQTLDADKANLDVALANVAEQQALVDKKTIRAPFTGQLGIRAVDVGQYLDAGTSISTLQALDTVFVDFFLPQQALAVLKTGQNVTVKTDTYPGQDFTGAISVINPKVELNTRNVQIRATLKNPDHRLLPGMYTTVDIAIGEAQRHITLPRSAVSFNPFGATVYLVVNKGTSDQSPAKAIAKQSFVTTGETRGDQIAVLTGVNEGDTVVTSGQIKLRNGTPVLVNNSVQPENDAAPQPLDQ
ncbi:MAG: efflux RND transporter periplasmic adaptor subunit [Methylovulum sp.]|nr:efflux RND transporter periplasmic adaptor subunit [Methylovulum sp.]